MFTKSCVQFGKNVRKLGLFIVLRIVYAHARHCTATPLALLDEIYSSKTVFSCYHIDTGRPLLNCLPLIFQRLSEKVIASNNCANCPVMALANHLYYLHEAVILQDTLGAQELYFAIFIQNLGAIVDFIEWRGEEEMGSNRGVLPERTFC